eukprot:Opistho-1_new@6229
MGENAPIFRDIAADETEQDVTEIESLCMNCEEKGVTRLLLTKIPFFKEVILMAFECPHCGYKNNEVQSGGMIQEKGIRVTLHVKSAEDLNRNVVKSDSATVSIPELDFEIPANTQKGKLTTIEGLLERTIAALEQDQDARQAHEPESAAKIESFLSRMRSCMNGEMPFTFIVDDPSGNSHIMNPYPLRFVDFLHLCLFRLHVPYYGLGCSCIGLNCSSNSRMRPRKIPTCILCTMSAQRSRTISWACTRPKETRRRLRRTRSGAMK